MYVLRPRPPTHSPTKCKCLTEKKRNWITTCYLTVTMGVALHRVCHLIKKAPDWTVSKSTWHSLPHSTSRSTLPFSTLHSSACNMAIFSSSKASEKQIPPHLSSNFSMSTPLHLLIHLHTIFLVLQPTNGFVSAPHSRLGGVLGGRARGPLKVCGCKSVCFSHSPTSTGFTQRNLCCISKCMRAHI